MIIKNRKTICLPKQLLLDKVKVSDKEIKDDSKKASHILIKVKSKSAIKKAYLIRKLKKKLKNPKEVEKILASLVK